MRVGVRETGDRQPAENLGARRRSVDARTDGRDPAVGDLDGHAWLDERVEPGVLQPVRLRAGAGVWVGHVQASPSSTSARASTPATQSSSVAYSAGECETPVGLRTNSMAVGMLPERICGVVPGAGAEDGNLEIRAGSQDAGEFVAQGVVELDDGGERLADDVEFDAVRVGVLASRPLDAADDGVEARLVRSAGVEPAADEGGDGVHTVRLDGDLAEGGDGTGELGLATGREHGLRVRQHGVAAVHEPSGPRMVGLTPEVEPPPPMRPDGAGDPDTVAGQVKGTPLLDMQLDERPDPGKPLGVRPDGVRVVPGTLHRRRQADTVGVLEPMCLLDGELSGREPRPDTGQPEPSPFLVPEVHDGEGLAELHVPAPQFVQSGEGGHDTEGAIEGTAIGDGVEMGPSDDSAPGSGIPEPGPLIPVPVHLVGKPSSPGLRLEPGPTLDIGPGPGEPPVATGGGVAPDGAEVKPHLVERGRGRPLAD